MNIFSYNELKSKAHREILRLAQAETGLDQEAAIDHALNAAFTIYHLIQWAQKEGKLRTTNKVQEYIETTPNLGLKILHSVVTCNKHVTVSKPVYAGDTSPQLEDNINYITTEDGTKMATEDGASMVTEDSNIKVYFGDKEAIAVLKDALHDFS